MKLPKRSRRSSSRQLSVSKKSSRRRHLTCEALETRQMLAGDVTGLSGDMLVRYEFVDSSGTAVEALQVGSTYKLNTYVQDTRSNPQGLFQAYLDVGFNANLITPVGAVTNSPIYNLTPLGSTSTPGLIDEVGGIDTDRIRPVPGGADLLLFSIDVRADAAGTLNLSTSLPTFNPRLPFFFDDPGTLTRNRVDVICDSIEILAAGVQFSRTTGLTTNEFAGTDTFTAVLTTAPAAGTTVSFTLASSDPSEGTVSPSSLTFNSSDWNVPKTVVVTGVDDSIEDGNVSYSVITGNVTSADSRFSGLILPDISVTNNDDTDSAGVSLNPSFGFNTNENGGQQSTNVRLTSQPTSPVTISFASSDLGEGTVSPLQLVFSATNWNQPQLLTLTGVADDLLDGPQNYTVSGTISSSDTVYQSLTVPAISATNQDTDVAAISVQPSSGLNTTELGGSDVFNVRLSAAPLSNVMLNIVSSDPSEGSVNVNQLTFTPLNWNDVQVVRVTGINDSLVDGPVAYQINVTADASSDAAFRSLPASSVAVTNADDDIPSLVVSQPNRTFTTESGGTASLTTRLTTQPSGTVTVSVASDDASEARVSPTSLTFNSSNWDQPQTITVTGENDSTTDGDVAYNIRLTSSSTSDLGYNTLPVSTVALTNRDDDVAVVVLTETDNLQVDEDGSTDTFNVSLQTQPLGNVTIQLASTNTSEVTVSPASIVFTPQNWNLPRPVTVAGVNDNVVDEAKIANITFDLSSSADAAYRSVTVAPVSVTNVGDRARLLVSPIAGLITRETGGVSGSDVFGVRLSRQPDTNVILQIVSSDTSEGLPTQTQLIFTPSNFDQLQQVTVVGVDDLIDDGDQLYEVRVTPTTASDAAYRSLPAAIVSLTNQDDDIAQLIVSQPTPAFTTEDGGVATVTVRLQTPPVGTVTVTPAVSDATEASIAPTTLTFNANNWNQPQNITVTGLDDSTVDGDVAYNVTLTSTSTTDPSYNSLAVFSRSLTNRNDDAAVVLLAITDDLQVDEDGGTDTFTVRLQSQPLANVTILLASSNTAEVTVSPASLSFTPQNWNQPKTVTVAGVNDNVIDAAKTANITFNLSTSADTAYRQISVSPVAVTNIGDRAGVIISPMSGLRSNEVGGTQGSDIFGVRLTRQPTSSVILEVISTDPSEGTPTQTQLTFTPANFDQIQQVTVVGVDDDVTDGDQVYQVSVKPTSTSASEYRELLAQLVNITNEDDDIPGLLVGAATPNVTTEAGGTSQFSVRLQTQPTGLVRVNTVSSDPSEGTPVTSQLTFTSANWNQPQNVVIRGVDDPATDGNVPYQITLTTSSSADANYAVGRGIIRTVSLTNIDNDPAGVQLIGAGSLETNETGTPATFTVRLQSQPLANVSIALASNRTNEVTVSPATLNFTSANWDQPQTVTLTGVDDGIVVDGNQTALISLNLSQSIDAAYRNVTVTPVSVTNVDNDVPGVRVIANAPLQISETGTSKTFTVALETPPSQNVTIMAFSNDASEGTVAPTSLVFNASNYNVPQSITVTGVDDSLVDGNVIFSVLLTAVSGDPFYDGITIADVAVENENDDVGGVQVIADNNLSVSETGTTTTFRVVLRTQPLQNVTVPLAVSDASELSIDTNQLVFTPANWNTPQTVTVTGLADNTLDADILSGVQIGPTVSNDVEFDDLVITPVNVTNMNVDTASISVTAADVSEGGPDSNAAIVYTVTLSGDVASGITLDYSTFSPTTDSAATAGVDYTARSGVVTLVGNDGETVQISVPIVGDAVVETNETVGVRLSGLRFGAGNGNIDDVSLPAADTLARILNDDIATLTISSSAPQVFEGNASEATSLTAEVTLSAAVQGGLSVDFATANGSATISGNDYVAQSGTLNFTGTLSETKTISVDVTGDDTPEPDETFSISLSQLAALDPVIRNAITIIDSPLTLTIQNDDAPKLILRNVSTDMSESNAGQTRVLRFEVELDADVNDPDGFTVPISTADGTATVASGDYVGVNSTLSFSGFAGEIKTVEVTVAGDDLVENDETFTLRLGSIAGLAEAAELVIPNPQLTATIANDDTAAITLTASQTSVGEGDSGTSTSITFTATLTEAVSSPFTVNYGTTNGTATSEDGDFTPAAGTLSFTGVAGQTQTFTVNVLGDNRLELAETFTVGLGSITGLPNSMAAAISLPSESIAVTISADDRATLTMSSTASTNEGDSTADAGMISLTVSLMGTVSGGLQLGYSTADDFANSSGNAVAGQDYVAANGQLSFSGADGETQTINITTIGDNIVEANETFRLNLGAITGLPAALISLIDITTSTAVATIVNDDTTTLSISGPATISEPGGLGSTVAATYSITLSAPIQGGLSIEYESNDVTATAGTDYEAAAGTVTFADGSTQPQSFTINVLGDSVLEADETFQLALTQLLNINAELTEFILVDNDFVTTTITDDDSVTVSFATTLSEVAETNGNHVVSLVLSTTGGAVLTEPLEVDVIVRQSSTAGSADFMITTTRVVFPIGSTSGSTQPIGMTIVDDGELEPTETIVLGLQAVQSGPGEIISNASHTVSITDDPADAVLSGFVWADTNGDAQRASHEMRISGVTMRLTGVDNQGQSVQRQVVTDINGRYEFRDLAGGTYAITQDQPSQFIDAVTTTGSINTSAGTTNLVGTVGTNRITQIVLPASGQGTGFNFTERGYRAAMIPFSALLASGGTTSSPTTAAPPSIHLPSNTSNNALDNIFANW